jgi:microcystin degradation protein MlrC
MRIFIAGFCHETSDFSPVPTNRRSFEEFSYHRPADGRPTPSSLRQNGYGAFARRALADGHDVVASTSTWAQPSGRCASDGYVSLRDEILNDLSAAGPCDMVLLFLHGAQTAEGLDDCEGDVLAHARKIVGPDVFIGVLLDLHANVTSAMIQHASALVACRLYPHTDFDERAEELYELGIRAANGDVSPQMIFYRLPMAGIFYTTLPGVGRAVEAAKALEKEPGVLSVSLVHGFAWADIAEMGAGVVVVTDGERPSGLQEASAIAQTFYAAREETRGLRRGVADVLAAVEGAKASSQPVVIADACDNAGGGAGSDSTFILKAVLDQGLKGYAFALLWDPVTAAFAKDAGVGGRFRARLGGKTGPEAGDPVDVEAKVLAIVPDARQMGLGFVTPMGLTAALEIAGNIVVVNTIRGQVFSPTVFSDLGVDVAAQRALVVKSTQHFHAQFQPIASDILYCETPGSMALALQPVRYKKLRRPIWPLDDVAFDAWAGREPASA